MIKLKKFLNDALFPNCFTCDLCGIETFGCNLCPDCLKTVSFNNGTVCPVCGRKTCLAEICMECKAKAPVFKKAVSPLVYENGSAQLIAKFKNGSAYLKDYFADIISEKLKDFPEFDCIVYVPATEKSEYKRGYNQSELLAKSLSERIDKPVFNVLVKVKDTSEQKSLSRKERENNLNGCFKVEKRDLIKGRNVLLVDDVLTTGATADALSKKLLSAGAAHIYLATVASVEYKPEKD